MTDILRLPGWTATDIDESGPEFVIKATYTVQSTACQKCGTVGNLYRHGTKELTFRDTPFFGKPGVLVATVQRYRCRECKETFIQSLGGIDSERRMTARCIEYIQKQCLRDTFTRVAEDIGCTEGTIRNIAGDRIEKLDGEFNPYLPEWLGVDETKLDRGMRCIITDVGNNRPIDILRDREKHTLATWLSQFKDRSKVKGLAIDMWKPYKDVAEVMFKDLPVVIDKFHVVRMANTAVDRVRIRLQSSRDKGVRVAWKRSKLLLVKRTKNLNDKQRLNLDMWLDNEPDIALAYRLKEGFFDIYDMPKEQAVEAYDAFPKAVPASMKTEFHELTRAMKNWRKEILAYFDHPISNGYTEALNGVAKVINRAGRGYSFEVMRARILYKHGTAPKPVSDMRCWSCHVPIDKSAEDLPLVIIPGIDTPPKRILVCAACNERIHTETLARLMSRSTHIYE